MFRYALRRFITSIITLYLVITFTFFLMQAVPGGPFLGEAVNPEVTERLLHKYGYDRPLMVQYITYIGDLLHGDLGYSIVDKAGTPVTEIIAQYSPVSFRLGMISILLAVLLGIPLGLLAAVKHNSLYDRFFVLFASFSISIPSFIMTITLMLIFGMWLMILPVAYLSDWKSYIMPVFGMAIYPMFTLGRLTRTTMLDVTNQDYIRTARAKGLSPFIVMFKHALRNAIIPVITAVGPMIAGVLTGSFVVERVFAISGIGKYFVSAVNSRDYGLIMGTTIFFAVLLIFCNYIVDLLYGVIDPRIKL
jgi:oligopeptide transport system permease protein